MRKADNRFEDDSVFLDGVLKPGAVARVRMSMRDGLPDRPLTTDEVSDTCKQMRFLPPRVCNFVVAKRPHNVFDVSAPAIKRFPPLGQEFVPLGSDAAVRSATVKEAPTR